MNYPLITEYIDAIRSAEDNFDKLTNLRPELDDNGFCIHTCSKLFGIVACIGGFQYTSINTEAKKDHYHLNYVPNQNLVANHYSQYCPYDK